MIISQEESQFKDFCKANHISVFNGQVIPDDKDIEIEKPTEFLNFCLDNGVKSIILDHAVEEIDEDNLPNFEVCKKELQNTYYALLQNGFFGQPFFKHIQEEFYLPIIDDTLEKMKTEIEAKPFLSPDDSRIYSCFITAYALLEGCRIYTTIISYVDETLPIILTNSEIIEKYTSILEKKLYNKKKEAKTKDEQIENEIRNKVISEITTTVQNSANLKDITSQKSCNAFADRIWANYAEHEDAYPWLTKKIVRSIVNREWLRIKS